MGGPAYLSLAPTSVSLATPSSSGSHHHNAASEKATQKEGSNAPLAPSGSSASIAMQSAAAPSVATPLPLAVSVNPVVYLSVVDHHLRRNADQHRVIGTLLGVRSEDGSEVEVRSCFPVPHAESGDQVAVDMEFHKTMHELHSRVTPNETIVGWYATGGAMNRYSPLFHEFYQRETQAAGAIHLLVNTDLETDGMNISAYTAGPVGLPESAAAASPDQAAFGQGLMFVNIPVKHYTAEKIGLHMLQQARDAPSRTVTLKSDLNTLETSIHRIKEMIETVSNHVKLIIGGQKPASNELCRLLLDVLSTIPQFDAGAFEKAFADHLQDVLMVVHLSNLTRTQLAIAERLQFL